MRLTKSGKPDKRYKDTPIEERPEAPDDVVYGVDESKFEIKEPQDPNELHDKLLKDNGLQLDFDVLEGTVSTQYGIIKLEKPTLIIKASYVK